MTQNAEKIGTWLTGKIPSQLRWVLLLSVATAIVFAQTVNFEFLYLDDQLNVYANTLVTQFDLARLKLIWSQPYQGLYIPLTYTVWGGVGRIAAWLHPSQDSSIFAPTAFHAANIIFHLLAALTVFKILRTLLGKNWPAAFGALFFALHPLQMTPVAWVSGMKQVLSGLLGLLAIWQYLRYARSGPSPQKKRYLHYLWATTFFITSLLALPSMASLPLIAAALSGLLLNRPWRKIGAELCPWLLLALPLVLITKGLQPSENLTFMPNLWQRILVAGDAITFYHCKLLWPFDIGPDYGKDPESVLSSGYVYLTGLLPYLIGLLLAWRCRNRWLLAAALVFVAALSPSLGFVSFQFQEISTVANRYLYLAMLAPALLGGYLLAKYPSRTANACAVALIMLLAIRSTNHLYYWQNPMTFSQHAIEVNPESYLAYHILGLAYIDTKQIPEAIAALKTAIKFGPNVFSIYADLGNLYLSQGLTAEAKTMYLKALELSPSSADLYLKLADLARLNGQPDLALNFYKQAVEISPKSAGAYAFAGSMYAELGQKNMAIENYRLAIHLDPNLGEAYNNLALLYEEGGRHNEAIEAYRQAMRLRPNQYDAFNNLGALYLGINRAQEAIPLLLQAVAISPGQARPCQNLGIAYLQLGQTQEAAKWFAKARLKDANLANPGATKP